MVTALGEARQAVDDAIGGGATFDEAAKETGLAVARLGPVAANGTDPDNPAVKPDPAMAGVIRAAFAIQPGEDDPQIAPIGTDGSFALVMPERVIPAASRPLDQIRKQVSDNYIVDQALKKARTAAADAVKRINAGTPVAQAIAAVGIKGHVPIENFDIERQQLLESKQHSAGIDRAFTLALKKADFLPDRDRVGYTIVYVDKIEEHDAKTNPQLIARVTADFTPVLPQEQIVQFVEAIRREVNVKRNEDAIKKLKEDLARGGTAQQ
jgi:peptidyl-prolyl cis-trans isomerase D